MTEEESLIDRLKTIVVDQALEIEELKRELENEEIAVECEEANFNRLKARYDELYDEVGNSKGIIEDLEARLSYSKKRYDDLEELFKERRREKNV